MNAADAAAFTFGFAITYLLLSALCGFAAQGLSKHPSSSGMFLLGFFLGPIGILIAVVAGLGYPPKQRQQWQQQPIEAGDVSANGRWVATGPQRREPVQYRHPVIDPPVPEPVPVPVPVIPADRHHYESFLNDELKGFYKMYSKSGSHPAVLTMLRRKLPVAKRDIMSRLQQIEDQEQAITHGEHLLDTVRRRLSAAARNIERGVCLEDAV